MTTLRHSERSEESRANARSPHAWEILRPVLAGLRMTILVSIFFASPALATHAPLGTSCPSSWRPQYLIDCRAPTALACGGGTVSEGAPQCRATLPTSAVSGQVLNCDSCAWTCPTSAPITCDGACSARRACADTQNRVTSNECTGVCGACRGGFLVNPSDMNGPCVAEPGRAYVNFDNTGELRAMSALKILGTDTNVSDLYMNSGRAIQIEGTGATQLDLRSGGTGNVGLVLRSPSTDTVAELRLAQADTDRWAVAVREGTGNFTIWRRGASEWDGNPRLRIDYGSGEVRVEDNLAVGGSAVFGRAISAPGATFTGSVEVTSLSAGSGTVSGALSAGGLTVGGRAVLTEPTPCTGSQVLRRNAGNTAWECGTVVAGGGGVAEEFDPLFTDWRTTGPRTLADLSVTAGLTAAAVTGTTVNATGCFGPTFVGLTEAVNGNQGGYQAADVVCAGGFAGSHVCTVTEILNSKSCDAATFVAQVVSTGWVLQGPPGFTANSNDCIGRTSADAADLGSAWFFDAQGGQGWLSPCNSSRPLTCCR